MKRTIGICLSLLLLLCVCMGSVACGKKDGDGHTHIFRPEWESDKEYHWHAAACEHKDEISEKSAHSFGEVIADIEPTPTQKGSGHKTCSVCGRTIYNIEMEYEYDTTQDVTLLFDVRGGEEIPSVTVKAGTTIDLSKYTVNRTDADGIEFEGWTTDNIKNLDSVAVMNSLVVKADTVVHAVYSCDAYFGKESIKLGKYPQSVVTDQTIINALDALDTADKNANGYYEYQGKEYAKEICNFESNSFSFERGKAYYFAVEPISWTYVDGRYTTSQILDFVGSYQLLEYLNRKFYDSLSDKEKALIADTKTDKLDDSTYKFYLWNVQEYAKAHADSQKQSLTDYALFRDTSVSYKEDRFTSRFWLATTSAQTPGLYNFYTEGGSVKWNADTNDSGSAGLLPCFKFDFKGIKNTTGDKTIRVTFDTNGGSDIPSVALISGENYKIAAKYVPTKEGFDFVGWQDKDGNKQTYDNTDLFKAEKDVKLYAVWQEEKKEYGITYELNGGAFKSSATIETKYSPENVVTFKTPAKESTISYDYTFGGWYLEEDFKTRVTSTSNLKGDITLYAKWIEQGIYFTIEYDLGRGESIVEAEYPKKVLCAEGSIDLPTVKRNGYAFVGWKITFPIASNDLITSLSTNRSGRVTLEPYFTPAYSIEWKLNGGTLANESELPTLVYAGAPAIDFTKYVPTREGCVFLYWSVSWMGSKRYGNGDDYEKTLKFTSSRDLPSGDDGTITAIFAKAYNITVNAVGGVFENGEESMTLTVIQSGDTFSFKNPAKNGANLIGWSSYDSCSAKATYSDLDGVHDYFTVEDDQTTFVGSKLIESVYDSSSGQYVDDLKFNQIYAIWDKVTLSFVTGVDGLTKQSVVVDYKTSVDISDPAFALEYDGDRKFHGWMYYNYSTEKDWEWYSGTLFFYRDTVLTAKWCEKLAITVVYPDNTQVVKYIFEGETIESVTTWIKQNLQENQGLRAVYIGPDKRQDDKLPESYWKTYKPKKDMSLYIEISNY